MNEEESSPGAKRVYQAPDIEETAPFEQLRLGCSFQDETCAELGNIDLS